MIFNRAFYNELWFRLESNELLGILDTAYIEDFYGVDGQVTLKNILTFNEYPILMSSQVSGSNTIFTGFIELSSIPNGSYKILGRVRDISGNYRILSDFQSPDILITTDYSVDVIEVPSSANRTISGIKIYGGVGIISQMSEDADVKIQFSGDSSFPASFGGLFGATLKIDGNQITNATINKDVSLTLRM